MSEPKDSATTRPSSPEKRNALKAPGSEPAPSSRERESMMNSVGQYLAEVENQYRYGPRRGFHVDTEFWKRMDRERKARGSEPAPPSRESVIERALPAASEEMDRGDKASLELETGLDNEAIQSAFDLIFSTLRNPDGTIHRSRSLKDKLRTLTSEPLLEQDNLAQLFIDKIKSMGEEGLCIMMANDPQNIIYTDDGIPNGFSKSTTRANKVGSKLPNERAVRLRVSGGLMYVEDYYMRESAKASPGMSTTASKPPQLKLCYPVPGYTGGDMEPHSKATIELEARELKRISKMAPDYDMSPEEREEYLKMTLWEREKYLTMSPEKRDEQAYEGDTGEDQGSRRQVVHSPLEITTLAWAMAWAKNLQRDKDRRVHRLV